MREVGNGRYRLIRELGRGGMGAVWLGQDTMLGRDVAIKELMIPGGVPAAERAVYQERVLREARIAGRLADPAVVTVHDLIKEDDQTYIVMELIKAPTLAELVERDGPLGVKAAATLAAQLLSALEAAHESGVVHRDVKPGNVMVPAKGTAKLTDFGIAQALDDPRLTATGSLIGSPAYMSPERLSGGPASPAWDLWALGATLFYATEGYGPFDRDSTSATMLAVLNERPQPRLTPGPLVELIVGLLEPDPERRLRPARAERLIERALVSDPDFTTRVDPPTIRTPPVGTPPAGTPSGTAPPGTPAVGTPPVGTPPATAPPGTASPAGTPSGTAPPGTSPPAAAPAGPAAPRIPDPAVVRRRRRGQVIARTSTALFAIGAMVLLYFTVLKPYLPNFTLGVPDQSTINPGGTGRNTTSSVARTSSPAMQPVLTLGPDGDIADYNLSVSRNDCLNWLPAKGVEEVGSSHRVGCYGPHDVEVLDTVNSGTDYEQEAPYPGVEELTRRAAAACIEVLLSDKVIGEDKETTLRFWVVVPTAEAWKLRTTNGYRTSDRTSSCFVGRTDGARLTEPIMTED